jgi:hypothetical protein
MMRKLVLIGLVVTGAVLPALSATNVSLFGHDSWAPNLGWIDWRGDALHGANFSRTYASGFLYSSNCGWINLGSGAPANGVRYSNASASDFGVNVDALSDPNAILLSGYAWGANIGWIRFDVQAQAGRDHQPRIDKKTGILQGCAWGANVGWLPLEGAGMASVRTSQYSAAELWAFYE